MLRLGGAVAKPRFDGWCKSSLRRALSSVEAKPTRLSPKQALVSSRITLDFIRLGVSGSRLEQICTEEDPITDRWSIEPACENVKSLRRI